MIISLPLDANFHQRIQHVKSTSFFFSREHKCFFFSLKKLPRPVILLHRKGLIIFLNLPKERMPSSRRINVASAMVYSLLPSKVFYLAFRPKPPQSRASICHPNDTLKRIEKPKLTGKLRNIQNTSFKKMTDIERERRSLESGAHATEKAASFGASEAIRARARAAAGVGWAPAGEAAAAAARPVTGAGLAGKRERAA